MTFKETGFRPFYHHVCALELNDKLTKRLKNCPEIEKSSHAVVYGYIDPDKGLMLEVLGAGKQAPKYFYFKDPYEGRRITISIGDVAEVPFVWFEKLEPRFYKKYAPRIDKLKQYDASEDVEKSREFDFLDGCREPSFPDDVRVLFIKEGLKPEECWVRIIGLGDHVLIGKLLNQPYQEFGVHEGDTIKFFVRKESEEKIVCVAEFGDQKLSSADLEDGTVLKGAVADFLKDKNDDTFGFVLAILRSSKVLVPCEVELSEEAQAILEQLKKEGKDLDSLAGEKKDQFDAGISFIPSILVNDGHKFFPVFSSKDEMDEHFKDASAMNTPFMHALEMAANGEGIEGIVLNAFTQGFVVEKDLFETISKLSPIVEDKEGDSDPGSESDRKTSASGTSFGGSENIQMGVGKMDIFNYALYQNDVAPIRGIRVLNQTGDPVEGLTLHIYSDFNFFKEYEVSLPAIPSGKPVDLEDPKLVINGRTLAELTETVSTSITVELRKNGETICGCRDQMQVLAYDQWQGGETYQDLLPAFVLPNHPAIPALLHDAADRLAKWGKSPSLEGYQKKDPNRVRDLAAAAYAAIQKKNIVYAEPPASFSIPGQRIRTPETILEQRLGTCMDMTLLYAACLEAIGLHPLLVMMKGHIFAGVWLKERSAAELKSGNVIIDNLDELKKRIDNGSDELTFIECTAMCSGKQVSFEDAEKAAKWGNLSEADEFRFAIDVFLARMYGVKPIPSRMKDSGDYKIQIEDVKESEITDAPKNLGISIAQTPVSSAKKITNKRELWESKLLDLSQHNMLLNLPLNASVMPIMSSHIDELEDALADGHEFHILPVADWIAGLAYTRRDEKGKESKPIQWLPEAIKERGVFELTEWPVSSEFDFNEKFRQEFRNHRLYTYCGEKQLDRELTTIYRAARSSQQENGVSSLYLAIGLMRWFSDPESETPSYAPLILLPIEIIRKSANQGYGLHARDEEPHFNTTLLEMLKQNYNLNIAGLDPLPADAHGIDIKKTFAIVRGALFTLKGWDVVESCVIGNFSFAQFAMWNDIHTAGKMLDNSKVVRSLMKGHVDWDISTPANLDEEETYLPITVDATQLQAIKMAAHGTTFVLHGPPGTGKSQTITGMIANLMAQGKTVLFVAEKMAALSVVQRRLSSLGIGDFCLELHSDKANKKQVLAQLEKALAIKHPDHKTEYEEQLKKATASRAKLDGYAKHLHAVHNSGYSLRDLIDLYETVRDEEKMIRFDTYEAGQLSREQINRHLSLLGQLSAAGDAVGEINGHPLTGVGLTSYSADVRSAMRRESMQYRDALKDLKIAAEKTSVFVGMDQPQQRDDYVRVANILQLYYDRKDSKPALFDLLEDCTSEIEAYYNAAQDLQAEEAGLLGNWKKDFLSQNMALYLSKHDAAGKKFFGKGAAMSAVVSELQAYALQPLSFDTIPAKLQEIVAYQNKKQNLAGAYKALPESAKKILKELPTKQDYQAALDTAKEYRAQADAFPGGFGAIRAISSNPEAIGSFAEYQTKYQKAVEAEKQFNDLLVRMGNDSAEQWVEEESAFCQYLLDHPAVLKDWGLYNQVRQECVKVGLQPAVDAYESGLDRKDLVPAYKKGFYYALINEIIMSDDVLSSFSGVTFNESIQQFKRLDDSMLQQTKSEIFYLLASRVPTSWDSPEVGMELNLLRKAIGSNARGMSIRSLFDRISHILQTLCPCMLMSPNSVAQYLAQDNNLFDIVIFDEASQLPTCKAIGALSRAKDAVIVGDPKQMPPTSFFAGSGPNVEDLALDDLDSILDDALALGIPSQHLQWHYRSTHESLIAFSNNAFYDNKMYTFPSANDRERHVTAVHVEGVYKNSTNIKEAEAVVAEIVRRFHDPKLKKQSIGVVTFNVKQQTLIENLLAKQFQTDSELDAWANAGEDSLFVKNLENVQGDERDVILFSIGYGPDEKGRISMNFGPINQAGGGKRLNVAFSRARVTMTIFSSIYSTDLKITENSPDGLVAFRDFLRFAEGHDLNPESRETVNARYAKAGILQSICNTITDHGFQCVPMVGHSDFHVDIAVVDPYEPTKYLMGIMLDGDGYKQTKNTRDREIAQIGVLKNLGWVLHRVWTIDWWDKREKVLKKIVALLEELKAESQKRHEAEAVNNADSEAAQAKRQEQESALRAELEKQAAEVIADDEEAETLEKEVHVIAEASAVLTEKTASVGEESSETEPDQRPQDAMSSANAGDHSGFSSKIGHDNHNAKENTQLAELFEKLKGANAEVVDKRENGGALWVIGDKCLSPIMQSFKDIGVHFIFKAGGGKATNGRDGWWARTDIVLPDNNEDNVSSISTPAEEIDSARHTNGIENQLQEPEVSEAGPEVTVPAESTDNVVVEDEINETNSEEGETAAITPIPYVFAELPEDKMSSADYISAANKDVICKRAVDIVNTEAPILRDVLIRKLMASFGVNKSTAVLDATEKALKAAKIKSTKQKGIVFCWANDQDPKAYYGLRVSNERSGDEICPQELRNAIVYALQTKGELSKDELIKEASVVLGYKRLGKNLEAALTAGVQFARSSGAIVYVTGGTFKLP